MFFLYRYNSSSRRLERPFLKQISERCGAAAWACLSKMSAQKRQGGIQNVVSHNSKYRCVPGGARSGVVGGKNFETFLFQQIQDGDNIK